MLIAAAAAKSTEMKKIETQSTLISPVPTRPSSPHGITNNIAASQNNSICRLQGDNFPLLMLDLEMVVLNNCLFIIYHITVALSSILM